MPTESSEVIIETVKPRLVLGWPNGFVPIPAEAPDRQPDRILEGLVETDANRLWLVTRAKETLAAGKHFGVFRVDLDWLKWLNDAYSHDLGDLGIRHSACKLAATIFENIPHVNPASVVALRSGVAADETEFFIFDLDEEDLALLEKTAAGLNQQPPIPLKEGASSRGVSLSVGWAHSLSDENLYHDTKDLPFDLFNNMRLIAKSRVSQVKIEKLEALLKQTGSAEELESFIQAAKDNLGDMRLDPGAIEALIRGGASRSKRNG